ncbi:serine O-acetyltransferase [Arcobacter sp. YIC-80]|uniref:serine O-acetyltransferase n=1 Tax=Arcobacter sp. YIC-80 TaxID=3376683 RepID=UPI00384E5246
MFENIKEDIKIVCYEKKFLNYLKVLIFSHTIHLIMLFRFGFFLQSKVPVIGKISSKIIEYIIRILYASDISCQAKIGKGLNIAHGHDIVIGSSVIIGDYCKIFNGVTLGNKNTETTIVEQPILCDNVIVSTGAKILGRVKLGKGCVIGANSVVLNDIPDNTVAVGIPAKVIKNI